MISEQDIKLDSTASVIRSLVYYDVFSYPLTESEIFENSNLLPNEFAKCKNILDKLVNEKIIFKIDNFYLLTNDSKKVENRIIGNREAVKWMNKAKRYARIISYFPYVRGVSVSGSLSKGIISNDPDIDYFIITKPNRLWFSRTLLVAFKKVFLANSHKYFCVNYFIDSENLEIEEHNLFTATEVITMIPLYGNGVGEKFYNKNSWIYKYYPNYKPQKIASFENSRNGFFKSFIEFLFNNRFGDWIDTYFMNVTKTHWQKKFSSKYSKRDFDLAFKSDKNISKHHPQNFQLTVQSEFLSRKESLEKEKNIDLKKVVF